MTHMLFCYVGCVQKCMIWSSYLGDIHKLRTCWKLTTRSMSYKQQFISNDFATSWNSWKNKKRPLAFFKILRNATFKCTSENFFAKQRLAKHYAKSLKKYTISHCTVINDLLRLKFSWSTQLLSSKKQKKYLVFFEKIIGRKKVAKIRNDHVNFCIF